MKTFHTILITMVLLTTCAERDKQGNLLDTPTAGSIAITADESLRPLVDAEIDAFQGIYHNAQIHVHYTSEGEAIDALLNDSARLTIVTRRLAEAEENVLVIQKIISVQQTLATGGIALIVNRQNLDTVIQLEDFKKILSGEISQWKWNEMSKSSPPLPLEVVFDQPNSGIIRFLKDSLIANGSLPANCFAVKGNKAVVEYVSQNPLAMGLIDVSWISDHDDSTANSFLRTITVLAVSRDSIYYRPYQAYIAQGQYPLRRDLVMISREARTGLASGFMAFLASEKGQRIVLKSGLVPATMPIRIIEVNHEPL